MQQYQYSLLEHIFKGDTQEPPISALQLPHSWEKLTLLQKRRDKISLQAHYIQWCTVTCYPRLVYILTVVLRTWCPHVNVVFTPTPRFTPASVRRTSLLFRVILKYVKFRLLTNICFYCYWIRTHSSVALNM